MTEERAQPVNNHADPELRAIVSEEERVLARVLHNLAIRVIQPAVRFDYDGDLIALRDEIGEARLEDVPALVAQMERLQQVAARRAAVVVDHVDARSPYFGRIVLEESGRKREVLIGRGTYLDTRTGVRIVDWRDAPVSRVYYRYDEGDDYDEVFGGKAVEGEVITRRSLAIVDATMRRIGSPQGTFIRARNGDWVRVGADAAQLRGGQGAALRPEQHHRPGTLGIGRDDIGREDKHLPEIAALIDPRQFDLITRPEAGLVVIQGGAGSGKTTIGLHRMAYLSYQQPRRFRPDRMLALVFNDALARYISRVLPALGVEGVPVVTYARWAAKQRALAVPRLTKLYRDDTPSTVMRLKKHPAMLKLIDERAEAIATRFEARLQDALRGVVGAELALDAWKQSRKRALAGRFTRLVRAVNEGEPTTTPIAVRHAVEREVLHARETMLNVAGIWSEILTDRQLLRDGFARHANDVRDGEVESLFRWCVTRCTEALVEVDDVEAAKDVETEPTKLGEKPGAAEKRRKQLEAARASDHDDDNRAVGIDGASEDEPALLDHEDDALLLRIYQRVRGPLKRGKEPLLYEHMFIDEAQDLSPVELAVVIETANGESVTFAGDTAQRLHMDNGFSTWQGVLEQLGLDHVAIEPLKLSYRSTSQIMEFANHVLGPLRNPDESHATRAGAPVESFFFAHTGDAVGFLAEALRSLAQSEPMASIALVSRFPEQADVYYQGLANAEVPNLRRIVEQDFPFRAGIDVTDVRQVKGLEFDYVILVEVSAESYPADDESRHLLHIAATRAAHQLWVTTTGVASPLAPEAHGDGTY
jgi:DNA helicase-2/ATP-dependent DNA helicase PcrA